MGKRLCYLKLEANDNKAVFHFIFTEKMLLWHHGPAWTVCVLKARMTRLALFWLVWPWLAGSWYTVRLHQTKLLCQGVLVMWKSSHMGFKQAAFTSPLSWKCSSRIIPFSCLYWSCMWTEEELGHYHTSLFFKLPPPFSQNPQHLKGTKWKLNTQLTHRS